MNKVLIIFFGLIMGVEIGCFFDGSDEHEQGKTEDEKQTTREEREDSRREISPVVSVIDIEEATIKIFENASPSVCFINTSQYQQNYWRRNITEIPTGSGSGFIWDKDGHVVTNFHVIKNANKITVTLSDHEVYDATVVGVEPNKDLAVLQIEAPEESLKPIKIGTSHDLKVGQSVFAIGNPFGLDHSLTTGIISAVGREIKSIGGRPIDGVIQTDAAINPGNSGGPLLDGSGRLIGVNTMIYSPSGASAGIGFSIPVDDVNWVVSDLIKYGELRRPVLGVSLMSDQYMQRAGIKGALVLEVIKGSPAQKAGFNATIRDRRGRIVLGDIIIAIDDHKIESNNDLFLILEKYSPGDKVEVTLLRNHKKIKKGLELGSNI